MNGADAERLASLEAKFRALTARLNALSEGHFEINAEGFRVGSTRLLEKLAGGLYHLHQRDAAGTENDLTDALSIQGVGVSDTAPTAAQVLVYDAALDEWVPASSSTPGAHALGGAAHTADTLANLNTKVSDATLDTSSASRTPSAHTVASHSDTTATGAELETLTDGSDADTLHDHATLATAAEAVAAVEAADPLDMANALQVDTINEHTAAAGVTIDGTLVKDGAIYPDFANYPAVYFKTDATLTYLLLDTGDYFIFGKGANLWQLYLGGAPKFIVGPAEARFYVPLNMTANKIVNLADPTVVQDAATKNYVDTTTVLNSLFDATTFLYATNDDTPQAKTPAEVMVILPAASTGAAGKVELAIASEINTGTDDTRANTPDALAGSNFGVRVIGILVSDPGGDAITTGNGKAYARIPAPMTGMNLVDVEASLSTVSSSGAPAIMVRRSRRSDATTRTDADMLSTALTIDVSEFDSIDAATPAVVNGANDDVVTGDHIHIDIDTAGTGAKGLFVELRFQLP